MSGFTVQSSTRPFVGPAFSVESLTLDHDGEPFIRDVVRAGPCVAVLPIHDGVVTLVRQYRAPLNSRPWEIPAGKIDQGEITHAAALRELREETGIIPAKMESLGWIHTSPGITDETIYLYVARGVEDLVHDDRQGPEEQRMILAHMSLDAALGKIRLGEITDAKTVCALLRA